MSNPEGDDDKTEEQDLASFIPVIASVLNHITQSANYHVEMKANLKILTTPGKGLLAADESTSTIGKRFEKIHLENTEPHRRAYRQLLFETAKESHQYIGGVILYEETLYQKDDKNTPFVDILKSNGIVPGIKVDLGLTNLPGNFNSDQVTQGLDDLHKRVEKYHQAGARFAKWRAAYTVNEETHQPSDLCVEINSFELARYAAICQSCGLIPIVEPEVLVTEGHHKMQTSYDVTRKVLVSTFQQLYRHGVDLERTILKPNMILTGDKSGEKKSHVEVAEATVRVLRDTVPSSIPAIMFLSGGQTEDEAAKNLNEINKVSGTIKPWYLTFSYGRALQDSCIKTWKGEEKNVVEAQKVFLEKAKNCYLAAQGKL